MENLTWIKAIEKVLTETKKELHYKDITKIIYEEKLIPLDKGGGTPSATVNKMLNSDINEKGTKSKFTNLNHYCPK